MLKVLLDGQPHTQISDPIALDEHADRIGVDVSRLSIDADDLATFEAGQKRKKIRAEIEPAAGDTPAIQGTIADNVGLIMEKLGRLALAHAQDEAAFTAAMADLANTLTPLVAAIDGGTCTMTHHVKGVGTVVSDACERSNAVAGVLIANAE